MNLDLKGTTNILEQDLYSYCKVSDILPTNTKQRRLGYLKLILNLFEESDYFPVAYFAQKVESAAQDTDEFLLEYRNTKGRIGRTRNGTSAKPYVELALNLRTVTEVNRSYILSKQSKVYRVISQQISKHGLGQELLYTKLHTNKPVEQLKLFRSLPNPFRLNLFEQVFFLYQILSTDSLYTWGLLDIINQESSSSERAIRGQFQEKILNELKVQLESNLLPNQDKRKAFEISNRIRSWEKPDVYLEHILMPRLNWLLDLDFIDSEQFRSRIVAFSDSGHRLHTTLTHFYQDTLEKSTLTSYILENSFFRLINDAHALGYEEFSISYSESIEVYIEDSFKYFRTAAPNSIAASQAILYCCYKMLLQHQCIVEFQEIKELLLNNQFPRYALDWYKRENDGSLYRRK